MALTTVIRGVNRLFMFLSLVYAVAIIHFNPRADQPPEQAVFGIFKFLTMWTAIVHIAFYGMCILHEMFWYLKFKTEEFSFRGLMYHALVFPMGMAVFLHFWIIYLSDPDLMVPKEMRGQLSSHINHILHTFIFPGMIIEGALVFHPLPKRKDGLLIMNALQLAYAAMVFYLGLNRNCWVYPFLALLPFPLKVAFFVVSVVAVNAYYLIGEALHKTVWRQKLKEM
ncbi:Androgen-dependent TFPI-regulating protein [Halotydeus destructor]|nr:Androgen-dependent TFPI-regulating protein [Halotydeus destructor]